MQTSFTGSIVAIVTPFDEDGQVDLISLEKHIEWQIRQGTEGIVACGTTGESPTLTHEEQPHVIEAVVQIVNGRIPVIAGAGSNSTTEAVSLTKAADRAGADGVLSVVPYYNKPTQQGLLDHYRVIRETTDLPIILYNVPGRTGLNMVPDTIQEICELGGIDSVKEASDNLDQCQELLNRGIRVLSGEDGITFQLMAMGASGVISVVANFAPSVMRSLCDAMAENDLIKARKIHQTVYKLAKAAFCETNPIPAKAAVARLGFCREVLRLPLTPLEPEKRDFLFSTMQQHHLL